VAQVVESLSRNNKALGSNTNTEKKMKKEMFCYDECMK
jgi:hypothetical protein